MKITKSTILLLLAVLYFSSCSRIVQTILGVKTEKMLVTIDEVREHHKKMHKKGLVSNELYYLNLPFDTMRNIPFKPRIAPPAFQFKCFDAKGELLMKYGICEGPHRYHKTFDAFPPNQPYNKLFEVTESLTDELVLFQLDRGEGNTSEDIKVSDSIDYYFTVYYADFLGYIAKRQLKLLNEYLEQYANQYRIKRYYLNIDPLYIYNNEEYFE